MTPRVARYLPKHAGAAAWAEILGDVPPQDRLEDERTADVAIIGGGFAGLSAARRLHQLDPHLRIAVIEAGRIAEGAAGRNSGFMIDIPHELNSKDYAGPGDDAQMIRLNRKAQDFGAQMVEEFAIPEAYFDRAGKINGAASPDALALNQKLASHLASLGETSEQLDATQMAGITGSQHYQGGLYTPGTVMLQPAGYVRGVAAGLRAQGISIHESSPVLAFNRAGFDWSLKTPKGRITAHHVILTNNGHLESFGFAKGRLIQLFLFAAMTPELDPALPGAARWGVTPSDPMGTTMRRIDTAQGGNRIITRTCAVMRPDMKAQPGDLRRAEITMQRKFDTRFPALKGLQMEHVWAGHLCLSLNGVSVARELDRGVFSGCVQNGLGTTRGTLAGIAAAEACLNQSSEIKEFFAAQDAPTRLPPKPFRQIGANALLRLKEFRARAE